MKARNEGVVIALAVAAALLLWPGTGSDASASSDGVTGDIVRQEVPAAVTAEKIAQGKELYASSGCATCHGPEAKGKPGMTADLTDTEWKFLEKGTFEELVKVLKDGLTSEVTGGMPMPAAAVRNLTDAQVEALAAYCWSISHSGS